MIVVVQDVAEHFNCNGLTAAKITRFLMRCSDIHMDTEKEIDFSFCGVRYCLIKTLNDWLMIRSVTKSSEDIDEVLS